MSRRVRCVTAYSLIVATPMALWLLRNYLAFGKFTRHQPPGDYPVSMMLWDVVDILWSWARTNPAAVLAPFVWVLVIARWRQWTVARWRPLWLFGGFALTYIVLLIAIISFLVRIYMGGGLQMRLLTPLYIPLLIAGAFALDRILGHERERNLLGNVGSLPFFRTMMPGKKGSVLAAIVMIVLSLGVARQMDLNVYHVAKANRGDSHLLFNGRRWSGSETVRYVRENLVGAKIYSNAPRPLFLHAGKNRKYAPCHHLPTLSTLRARQDRFWRQDDAYVVWFYRPWKLRHRYDEAALRSLPGLKPVAELADGIVFKVAAW